MLSQSLHRSLSSTFALVLAVTLLGVVRQWLIPTNSASAKTNFITVSPGESIQAAIDSASAGDTIVVSSGLYTENLTLNKAVNLTGVGSATTMIRPASMGSILTVNDPSISNSIVISGLTFTGGATWGHGGGLYISNGAQPLVQNTVISGNSVGDLMSYGGGMYTDSPLVLINVKFIHNIAPRGAGLFVAGPTVVLTDCQFIGNLGGGGIASEIEMIPPNPHNVELFNTNFLSNTTYGGGSLAGVHITGDALIVGGRFENNQGGGLHAGSANISGTRFINNSAPGGGAAISAGDVIVTGGYFEGNVANSEGGAIRAYRSLMLSDTIFISNTSVDYGGAVYVDQILGVASVTDSRFINNRVTSGSLYGLGGGLFSFYDIAITATDFISNSALRGGGVYARGPATVNHSRFERNHSTMTSWAGGGGMVAVSSLNMTNTQFLSNSAMFDGGGLYFYADANARIVNSLFAHNTANSDGAGLFLYSINGRIDLLHTTIADYALNPRQGIFVQHGLLGITNTLITNHAIGIERWAGATVYEDYNLFYGNSTNVSGTIVSGSHHPIGDPKFVNPAAGNYHLQPGSAAIDVGTSVGVLTDIDGEARPYGIAPDLGADEYWSSTLPVAITDLRAINVITDSTLLTTTLRWTAPLNALTYTLRYSSSLISAGSWDNALNITVPFTASVPGTLESVDVIVPYAGGAMYFAFKSQNEVGVYSSLSNNAFWPRHDVYLPLIMK